MLYRISIFVVVILFTSCNKIGISDKSKAPNLNSVVDFTSVDFSPSFTECDSLIDKTKKSDCFRETIHQKIGEELENYQLTVKDSIDEVVYVDVLINSYGTIICKEITSTDNLKQQLPQLDSLLKQSVKNLPKINAAVKRGIPVSTKYRLPIRIQLQE